MTLCNLALNIRNMTGHFGPTNLCIHSPANLSTLVVLCLAALTLPAQGAVNVVRLRGSMRANPANPGADPTKTAGTIWPPCPTAPPALIDHKNNGDQVYIVMILQRVLRSLAVPSYEHWSITG